MTMQAVARAMVNGEDGDGGAVGKSGIESGEATATAVAAAELKAVRRQ